MPCGGMTAGAAAVLLDVPADRIQISRSEMLHTCSFLAGIGRSVSYALYAEADGETADREMAKVVDGLRVLAACEPAAGLGDAAAYCSGDRAERLLVRSGRHWVDVLSPSGLEPMSRVAREVLTLR